MQGALRCCAAMSLLYPTLGLEEVFTYQAVRASDLIKPDKFFSSLRQHDDTGSGKHRPDTKGEAKLPLAAKPMPLFVDVGQGFTESTVSQLNLESKGLRVTLGPAFSFYAKVRFNSLKPWARIFDFGDGLDKGNIVAAIIPEAMSGGKAGEAMLNFEYHPTDPEARVFQLHSRDLMVRTGETHEYLFTIDQSGQMKIWRDGYMLVEKTGTPVEQVSRPKLLIGDSNFNHPGESGVGESVDKDGPFTGDITDIRVFNASVDWSSVTAEKEAIIWPGLENGQFLMKSETGLGAGSTYTQKAPTGWQGEGTVFTATAAGCADLGGVKPEDDEKLYTVLQDKGALVKQYVKFLTRGAQYWVAFVASSTQGTDSLLTVSVDGSEYISGVAYDSTAFSTQYFSFIATREDGKALLEFKNSSPDLGKGATKCFLGNIRISDAPSCYKKYIAQSKCIHDQGTKGTKSAPGANETECRSYCEEMKCTFMLYDPVSFQGASACEIYPDCNMMSAYYGGESGVLFTRIPCAAGGMMSPEAAQFYRMPTGAPLVGQIPSTPQAEIPSTPQEPTAPSGNLSNTNSSGGNVSGTNSSIGNSSLVQLNEEDNMEAPAVDMSLQALSDKISQMAAEEQASWT